MARNRTAAQIKACRDEQNTKYDAYYQTVLISVGLKHIFNHNEPCKFEINEPTMKVRGNGVTPDTIFQCDDDTKGIVAEIKSSLPDNNEHLLSDMKEQIEKYSEIEDGWVTSSGKIDNHSILLLINRLDSKRLDDLLKIWLTTEKIETSKNICVAEWQSVRSHKIGPDKKDIMLLNHRSGTTGCEYFDQKLKSEIKIPEDDLIMEYESRKFVKSVPPDLYLVTNIYLDILPTLANGLEEFEVTIDQIWDIMSEYYASWSGLKGEQSQIRKSWISKAMGVFCEIKLAEKIVDKQNTYKIKWKKGIKTKNVQKYLLDLMCGKEKPTSDEINQKTLTEFE